MLTDEDKEKMVREPLSTRLEPLSGNMREFTQKYRQLPSLGLKKEMRTKG